jgi:Ca2+-dependent lipid-binding protein
LINTTAENFDEPLDMLTPDEEISQPETSTPSRKSLNKSNQRTRGVLNRSPSLTSIITNTSSIVTNPEIIYWIELLIERGKDLSIKDFNGTSDPYVKVYYGTEEKFITSTIYKNLNPIWNEKVSFFVYDLNIPIYFYLFDYDRIGRDESMGSTKIDLWKLPLEKIYNTTLELENEKRTDGKIGMLQISTTITSKTSEFRDEVRITMIDSMMIVYFI